MVNQRRTTQPRATMSLTLANNPTPRFASLGSALLANTGLLAALIKEGERVRKEGMKPS